MQKDIFEISTKTASNWSLFSFHVWIISSKKKIAGILKFFSLLCLFPPIHFRWTLWGFISLTVVDKFSVEQKYNKLVKGEGMKWMLANVFYYWIAWSINKTHFLAKAAKSKIEHRMQWRFWCLAVRYFVQVVPYSEKNFSLRSFIKVSFSFAIHRSHAYNTQLWKMRSFLLHADKGINFSFFYWIIL